MINTASVEQVQRSTFSGHFVKPLYNSYCFSNIPQTIKYTLTGKGQNGLPLDVFGNLPKRYKNVVFFFIDGFGWQFWELHKDTCSFLKRFEVDGVVSKLTAQFPSTTIAHTTTISTGVPVGQHGWYEWFLYEPVVDDLIIPLLFEYVRSENRKLSKTLTDPKNIFPASSVCQALAQAGIQSYAYQNKKYAHSPYSTTVLSPAAVIPYESFDKALDDVVKKVLSNKDQGYYFVYTEQIDAVGHMYGLNSIPFKQEVKLVMNILEQRFFKKVTGRLQDTLVVLVSDHGLIDVSDSKRVYINQLMPDFDRFIQRNAHGTLLVPAGSPRDFFIHIKPELLDEAEVSLKAVLRGIAEVYKTQDLIKENLFGLAISERFLERVGSLVILPYSNNFVWWYEQPFT